MLSTYWPFKFFCVCFGYVCSSVVQHLLHKGCVFFPLTSENSAYQKKLNIELDPPEMNLEVEKITYSSNPCSEVYKLDATWFDLVES